MTIMWVLWITWSGYGFHPEPIKKYDDKPSCTTDATALNTASGPQAAWPNASWKYVCVPEPKQ